jgi:acid phosphatase type 7
MSRIFSASLIFVVLFAKSFSQNIDNDDFIVTHGPYLQDLTGDGVTVIWSTNKPAVPGIRLTAPDGTTRFIRNSHDGLYDAGKVLHKVRISGLEPGITYRYSLHSVQLLKFQAYRIYYGDTLVTRAEVFTTPVRKSGKVSFTVINDVHGNSGKMASCLRNSKPADNDLYFFNGDMVDFLQDPAQLFPGFIDTAAAYFASCKPFYFVRGNHETRGFAARDLRDYFDFSGDNYYYSFDRGPVHFIIIDCGEDKPDDNRYYYGLADFDSYRLEELEWLKRELKSDAYRDAAYRIVIVHMPIILEEKQGHGQAFLADKYGPVLQGTGVDLMISAHTHRNSYYDPARSGFGYPVLVNSNNTFLEVVADQKGIRAVVRDTSGKQVTTYAIKHGN